MLNSLYVAALGMHAQKSQLDVVSNNLSNANTAGFKREKIDFSAMLDRQAATAAQAADPSLAAQSSVSALRKDFSQGELKATGSTLDLAINGAGLLPVDLGNGRTAYIRGGSLRINQDGVLTTQDGQALNADVRIPAGASELRITEDGSIFAKLNGELKETELGRLQLVLFANADDMDYLGSGLYVAREGREPALKGMPGEDGLGRIMSGSLEMSNVKLVDEMVTLMMAQRVYELNSKVAQAADELMAMTNNMRRG